MFRRLGQILFGPYQSCEDQVCQICSGFIREKNYDGYRECKKTCFRDQKDEISKCCAKACGQSPECLAACQPLDYGG